jgi:hypothetical protein
VLIPNQGKVDFRQIIAKGGEFSLLLTASSVRYITKLLVRPWCCAVFSIALPQREPERDCSGQIPTRKVSWRDTYGRTLEYWLDLETLGLFLDQGRKRLSGRGRGRTKRVLFVCNVSHASLAVNMLHEYDWSMAPIGKVVPRFCRSQHVRSFLGNTFTVIDRTYSGSIPRPIISRRQSRFCPITTEQIFHHGYEYSHTEIRAHLLTRYSKGTVGRCDG